GDRLAEVLAPLASRTVTTIVGFTEHAAGGRLFNSAAGFRDGGVVGIYRKHRPAINRSVYRRGDRIPVFEGGGLRFGGILCTIPTPSSPRGRWSPRGRRPCSFPRITASPRITPGWRSSRGRGKRTSHGRGRMACRSLEAV